MVKVRAKEILMEQGHTKYWLYKRMGLGYQNLSNILDGKTTSMRYDTMEKLCNLLQCTPNDLFEFCHENVE